MASPSSSPKPAQAANAVSELMLYLKRVISLLRAIFSLIIDGDERLIVYEDRQKICWQCDELRIRETGVFCWACKCPPWPVSDLRTKWRLRSLKCPLNRW